MYRLLLIIFMSLLAHNAWALTLKAHVDRTNINVGETILLTVTLNKHGVDELDTRTLELQFDILQRQQNHYIALTNGNRVEKSEWNMVLSPKETGKLIIPSLSSMGAYSEAITITVNKNRQQQQAEDPDVFLEATVDKHKVFVQEQLLLTIRLYYRISLSNYDANPMVIDQSTVELTAENKFETSINGVRYYVLENTYAIHPQASGTLTIPAQSGQATTNRTFGFGLRPQTSPYLTVQSQPINVEVLPIPATSTADHWLPASSITLTPQWQQSTIAAKVGEPLNFSITLEAEGLQHSQLPSITLQNHDHVTIYTDKAGTDNQLSQTGITGTRTENYTLIPQSTGIYTLPAITLTWWNINTGKEETATIEEQRIIVANTELNITTLEEDNAPLKKQPTALTDSTDQLTHKAWQIVASLSVLLNLLFILLWRREKRRKTPTMPTPAEHATSTTPSLHDLYKHMDSAIEAQQWHKLVSLLQQWASIKTQKNITHNQHIIDYFPELKHTIITLEKQLYSHESENNTSWNSQAFITLLKKQHVNLHEKTAQQHGTLQPLYQHH